MSSLEPLLRLFQRFDELCEVVVRTPWGVVAADSRFPLIYDANYASVDVPSPDLALQDVEAVLLPALEKTGARHEQIVMIQPEVTTRLVRELEARGDRLRWDSVMKHRRPPEPGLGGHRVGEVRDADDSFWTEQRRALREFEVTDPDVVEQLVRRNREVLLPWGKRWFVAHLDGAPAGYGSLVVVDRVAYIDDVVTFPEARRRGVASSVMSHMLGVAEHAGASAVYLLADDPDPIRLYGRLGFDEVARIAGVVTPLDEAGRPRG